MKSLSVGRVDDLGLNSLDGKDIAEKSFMIGFDDIQNADEFDTLDLIHGLQFRN